MEPSLSLVRTHDMDLVKSIMLHDSIWQKIHDDGCIGAEPQDMETIYWLIVYDNGKASGMYLVYPLNAACYEMHTCLLPEIWGQKANKAAQLLANYLFGVIGVKKVITNVPKSNKIALKYALRNGMTIEGVNRESFLKNGALEDQTMLGMTLKEWELCQQHQQL